MSRIFSRSVGSFNRVPRVCCPPPLWMTSVLAAASTSASCSERPPGEVYVGCENPKGELGFYLVSDGTPKPYRCKIRGPSFSNLATSSLMAKGGLLSDLVAVLASVDITLGEVDR